MTAKHIQEAWDKLRQERDELAAQVEVMRWQRYELMGVLADMDNGDEFDDTCKNTLWRVVDALTLPNPAATIETRLFKHLFSAPQPPAPCPAPLDESHYCPDCEALQAKVAEQSAEIERLTACLSKANAQTEHFEREWYLRGDAIEHQAERIAELESLRGQDVELVWNSLTDDGDVLRLAMKLVRAGKLRIQMTEDGVDVFVHNTGLWVPFTWTFDSTEPSEAFRRCVTGAAAEIGKVTS